MENCVIAAYGRSAIGRADKGSLAAVNPVTYGAEVLKGVLERIPQLSPGDIDDVIVGCAMPEGKMGLNPARNIVIRAGLPDTVPGQTVNRFCASGIQTMAIGAAMIMSGLQTVVVAGGVESMTSPVHSAAPEYLEEWLMQNTEIYTPMGITAENVAARFGIARETMEHFAVESHIKAAMAVESGAFAPEIIPVTGIGPDGASFVFDRDEGYRKDCNMASLAKLRPAFKPDGVVTAATSSQRSDGAAFLVLMSECYANEMDIEPLARIVTFAVEGLDPAYMGLGPIYAVESALAKANLTLDDMDVIELNEAFASQAIATIKTLKMNPEKVNPWGGAIALGHPLGATGAILAGKALSYLTQTGGKYGLITMCVGGGMGAAMIIEKL